MGTRCLLYTSIAYPFGVIGVILFVKLLPRIMRIDLDKEARRLEKERRSQFPEQMCIRDSPQKHQPLSFPKEMPSRAAISTERHTSNGG